jgi:hypothetical protein
MIKIFYCNFIFIDFWDTKLYMSIDISFYTCTFYFFTYFLKSFWRLLIHKKQYFIFLGYLTHKKSNIFRALFVINMENICFWTLWHMFGRRVDRFLIVRSRLWFVLISWTPFILFLCILNNCYGYLGFFRLIDNYILNAFVCYVIDICRYAWLSGL